MLLAGGSQYFPYPEALKSNSQTVEGARNRSAVDAITFSIETFKKLLSPFFGITPQFLRKQVRGISTSDLLISDGAPGRIRTADACFRRVVLYLLDARVRRECDYSSTVLKTVHQRIMSHQ